MELSFPPAASDRPPDTLAQAAHGPKRRNNSHVLQHIDLADPQSSRRLGENDPARRRAAIDEIFTKDCVFYDPKEASTEAATRSIESRVLSRRLTLIFDISQ